MAQSKNTLQKKAFDMRYLCFSLLMSLSSFNALIAEENEFNDFSNLPLSNFPLLDKRIIFSPMPEDINKDEWETTILNHGLLSVAKENEDHTFFVVDFYEYDSQLLSEQDLEEAIEDN